MSALGNSVFNFANSSGDSYANEVWSLSSNGSFDTVTNANSGTGQIGEHVDSYRILNPFSWWDGWRDSALDAQIRKMQTQRMLAETDLDKQIGAIKRLNHTHAQRAGAHAEDLLYLNAAASEFAVAGASPLMRGAGKLASKRPGGLGSMAQAPVRALANLSDELTVSADVARARLRSALGLARGNADEAHHLIPLGLRDHDIVQRAARGGFNFNGIDNGVAMSFDRHRGVNIFHHNKYNDAIRSRLERELLNNPNMTDAQAADFLRTYAEQLRNAINKTRGRLR